MAGFLISGVTLALFPWGGSLGGWFGLRLLNGIGGAMSLIPLETYVNRHSPPEQCFAQLRHLRRRHRLRLGGR